MAEGEARRDDVADSDAGSAQGPGDDSADGLGGDVLPGSAGAEEPEALAGVAGGLGEDNGVRR